jgi:hypothetical protein
VNHNAATQLDHTETTIVRPHHTAAAATAALIKPLTLLPPSFQHCHHCRQMTTAIASFTVKDNTPHVATVTAIAAVGQPTIENHSPHVTTNTISTLPLQIPI